jgi:(E)-4-hydroxy-3-methyl-but-2-enyl pyrophosphate reductase
MEIHRAAAMGFCYGVKRAMKIAEDTAKAGKKAATLGPLIHNPQVVEKLAAAGIPVIDTLEKFSDEIVIIRSHGVGPLCYNTIKCKNLALVDATCPFVMRNQQITKELVAEGHQVVLIGEKNHPEMKSVAEWALGKSYIIETPEDAEKLPHLSEAHIVIQTTFSESLAETLIQMVSQKADRTEVHKTICRATSERQEAARALARDMDVMIVIGGRNSANTTRLAEVCREEGAKTHHIETAGEIRLEWFRSRDKIGITAGASTPDWIIEEVVSIMEDMNELLESQETNLDVKKGSVVTGTVVEVNKERAMISFGYKTEAVLPAHEYAFPVPEDLGEILHVGDEVRVQIINAIREDSPIYVSKIKVDRLADWDVVEEAFEKDETVECKGIEAIKVGLLVQIKSLRGFIPLSQGDLRFVHSLASLQGKTFEAKILEVDRAKNRLVLSRKAVLEAARNNELDSIEAAYENGDVLTGVVKKIMPYGAFINVNGVEGLLHISDISWKKIAKVEDVLSPEEEIEVKIKSFDKEKQRISFTHKECLPDPWEAGIAELSIDDVVDAKVVKVLEFGVIVELEGGLTGLLHINEMTEDRNAKPSDICALGDNIVVRIIGIDEARKRISFSLVEAAVHEESAE